MHYLSTLCAVMYDKFANRLFYILQVTSYTYMADW